ncbi:hypothetical protein HOL34_03945 [bacterium]|jgi:hypothetical protein|nr:hypothetical protein [bacterium]MBT3903242.1 hypothetical protein [bacterium]MBT4578136.1 hypothetical protein [bacterium]MBT5345566.1 hypothetical protein [bacterium]MBT6131075.1 hypothetical protein [bacterium]
MRSKFIYIALTCLCLCNTLNTVSHPEQTANRDVPVEQFDPDLTYDLLLATTSVYEPLFQALEDHDFEALKGFVALCAHRGYSLDEVVNLLQRQINYWTDKAISIVGIIQASNESIKHPLNGLYYATIQLTVNLAKGRAFMVALQKRLTKTNNQA